MLERVLLVLFVVIGSWQLWKLRGFPLGAEPSAPVDITREPEQAPIDPPDAIPLVRDGRAYTIERTHTFDVSGQVLSASTYAVVFANDFFDVDLGLVWGPSVAALLDRYDFHQDHRWLFWSAPGPVSDADRRDVTTHVANVHLIPSTPAIDRAVRWVDPGDPVRIQGALVRILDADGREVSRSSTSREDTGGGACEIVWVERFENDGRAWR